MTALTIEIDDDLVARLRHLAEDRKLNVEAVVQAELSASMDREESRRRFRRLVANAPLQLEPGWTWNREDCYDRPSLRGYKRPPVRGDGSY